MYANLRCVMCFAGNSNKILKDPKNMAEHFNWKEGRLEKEAEKYTKAIMTGVMMNVLGIILLVV